MMKELHIGSKIANIRAVEKIIDDITGEQGINQECYGKILIATLEAVNNAILHGNKADETKFVDIRLEMKGNDLKVTVTDEGKGFRPAEIPDPTMPENLEAINGRGVFLMRKLADKIEFNKKGNSVTMTFKKIKV